MTDLDEAVERLDEYARTGRQSFGHQDDLRAVLGALRSKTAYEDVLQKLLSRARRERDEALAVIERIDGEVKNFEQSDNDALSAIEHVLSKVTPADVLRERDAEKFDAGAARFETRGEAAFDENPYRKEQS